MAASGTAAVFDRCHASDGEPEWVTARRHNAWTAFTSLPMPSSTRDEDWRRTDVRSLDLAAFAVEPDDTDSAPTLLDSLAAIRDRVDPAAGLLVNTRAGIVVSDSLDRLTAQGVTVCSIDEACVRHPELVRRALDTVQDSGSKFITLWNALRRGGAFVHVPPGTGADVPVVVVHGTASDAAAIFPATLCVVETNASLTLVEAYASPAGEMAILSDAVTAIVADQNAQVDYCTVQRWGIGAWHVATQRTTLGRDARLRMFGAALGARLQKVYWEALLTDTGADARIDGIVVGDGRQHLDTQSLQAHRAPQTSSNLLLKVAVRDSARSVYSGLIEVDKVAQKTDGYVANRNLLLSEGARASGVPRLEIKADDVRCGHGATVGHIDEEQRFYLESRGVPTDEADRIIVRGFFDEVLQHSPHQGFAAMVNGLLDIEVGGRSAAGVGSGEA